MIAEPDGNPGVSSQGDAAPDTLPDDFLLLLEDYEEALQRGVAVEPSQWLGKHYPVPQELRAALEELYWLHREDKGGGTGGPAARIGIPEVPGYEILEVLGRGGMAVVYKANQLRPPRPVALKMILGGADATQDELARFEKEPEAVARLRHPHIVQVYQAGEQDGRPFFVMEYMDGGSLDKKLNGTPQPTREAAQLVETLARAVHAAHEQGIVHRDLKPANVLLTADGTPKVADFGLAKRLDVDLGQTQTGAIVGTPSYMAPEQAAGNTRAVGPAADIHALGVLLYELLTGRAPYKGASLTDTLEHVQRQEPVPPRQFQPKVPRDLETICLKCLQKEPAKRYGNAEALADDLRRFLDGKPIVARRVSQVERVWRWCRRNPAVAGLATAFVLAVLTGLAFSAFFVLEAERRLYVSDMRLTPIAWADGNMGLLDDLLHRGRPTWASLRDLRGWEWHYWHRLRHVEPPTFKGHTETINAVAFSPDGYRLASAGHDGTVRIWDVASRKEVYTLAGHAGGVSNVAFSPDGRYLASGGADKTVRLWDAAGGQLLLTLGGHAHHLYCMAFSLDSRQLTTAGAGGDVKAWETSTGRELPTPAGDFGAIGALWNRSDGRWLALVDRDRTVRIWDGSRSRESLALKTSPGTVRVVALSPDERWLASVNRDELTITIWDAKTGQQMHPPLSAHTHFVQGLAFSPDGRYLASGSLDTTVKIWNATSRKLVRTFRGHTAEVHSLAFSPDGRQLASASTDMTVKVWDVAWEQESLVLDGHKRPVHGVAFSPDGKLLASAGGDTAEPDGEVRVLNLATGREVISPVPHTNSANWVAFSPDGSKLAWTSGTEKGKGVIPDTHVRIMDVATGKEIAVLKGHEDVVWWVAFSPNGKLLATASEDKTVRVWDTRSWTPIRNLTGHTNQVHGVAFSPDSRRLASADGDRSVKVWDVESGQELLNLEGHTHAVWCVVFSPDGKKLASCGNDATVRLWDAASGKPLHTLKGHVRQVSCVAFSPDGKRLASAGWDETVKLWDVARGEEVLTLRGHTSRVFSVAFSPDGEWLASGSHDKTIRLWDARPVKEN